MKKIGFSGTLDRITNGHMWVIGEARSMADEVIIFLSENPTKKPNFPAEIRKEIIEKSAVEKGWNNIQVIIVRGDYTARAAKNKGVDYLIRGIRNTADFDYENLIQQTNVDVLHGAKTVFVMPPRDLGSVSASFVKALQGPVGWHWNMKAFLPRAAYDAWILDWLCKEWEGLWQSSNVNTDVIANAKRWFEYLTGPSAYGGPSRHYHTLDHLVHGLSEIRVWGVNVMASQEDIDTIKKAFWFHDAVYDHNKNGMTDEEASAQIWLSSGLDTVAAEGPADLIRATDHFQELHIEHHLKDVMLGVDLSILGQSEDVYEMYATSVRDEYNHVTDTLYARNRRKVLAHLHNKAELNQLYSNNYFDERYNAKAKENMAREIAKLAFYA